MWAFIANVFEKFAAQQFYYLFLAFFFSRFLGYFQPKEGKPALWELDSDYYLHVSGIGDDLIPE